MIFIIFRLHEMLFNQSFRKVLRYMENQFLYLIVQASSHIPIETTTAADAMTEIMVLTAEQVTAILPSVKSNVLAQRASGMQ